MSKRVEAPLCGVCGKVAALVKGEDLQLQRKFANKPYWLCPCGAYCGCHASSNRPIGFPVGTALRRARIMLHEKRVDPLWMNAHKCEAYDRRFPQDTRAIKMIQNSARTRVYKWLAEQLKVPFHPAFVETLTLEQCRVAWKALAGLDYPTVRLWAKMRENHEGEAA